MKLYRHLLYALLVVLSGCSKLEDPDLVKLDDIILILAKNNEKRELKANGREQLILLARLPEAAGRIDVLFSTTAGSFVYTNDTSTKEMADSVSSPYRYARALLRADSIKAGEPVKQVYVTAEAGNSRSRITLTFKP